MELLLTGIVAFTLAIAAYAVGQSSHSNRRH